MPLKIGNKNIVKIYRDDKEITKAYLGLDKVIYQVLKNKFIIFRKWQSSNFGIRKFNITDQVHVKEINTSTRVSHMISVGTSIYVAYGELDLKGDLIKYDKDLNIVTTVTGVVTRKALASDGTHIYVAYNNTSLNNQIIRKYDLNLQLVSTQSFSVSSGIIYTLTLDNDNIYVNFGQTIRVHAKSNLNFIRSATLQETPYIFYTHEGLSNVYIAYTINNRGVYSYSKSGNLEATTNSMPNTVCGGVVSDGNWVYFADGSTVRKATMGLTSIYDSRSVSRQIYSLIQDEDNLYVGLGSSTSSFQKLAGVVKNTMASLFNPTTAGDTSVNYVNSIALIEDGVAAGGDPPPPPPEGDYDWVLIDQTDSGTGGYGIDITSTTATSPATAKAYLQSLHLPDDFPNGWAYVGNGSTWNNSTLWYVFNSQEI